METSTYRTPEYYHCLDDARLRDSVYEPEADTFLFLDALDADRELLRALQPRRCVEVGCGSGTVITHLFAVLHAKEAATSASAGTLDACSATEFCAVDINPTALEATAMTWRRTLQKFFASLVANAATSARADPAEDTLVRFENLSGPSYPPPSCSSVALHLFHGDLMAPLAASGQSVDVVLFNPPYVPTSAEELEAAVAQRDVITAAWCGGPKGRVVLDRFLHMLPQHLSDRGVCYIALIRENDEADVARLVEHVFRRHRGLSPLLGEGEAERVTEMMPVARRYTGEHLSIHRISCRR